MSMESSLPEVPRKFQILLLSPSSGRGHMSWACLCAAGAAPVPAFKKPKRRPEEIQTREATQRVRSSSTQAQR